MEEFQEALVAWAPLTYSSNKIIPPFTHQLLKPTNSEYTRMIQIRGPGAIQGRLIAEAARLLEGII